LSMRLARAGEGSGVVVGKLLKFYIEFNCLHHERIA